MLILKNEWKFEGKETYAEAEDLEEDEIDPDDDEYYEVVEYYEKEDGSSAEVYYSDYGKKEVSDIRFWMTVDDDEKKKFMAAVKKQNLDWKPDEDSILYDEDAPYKGFLYQKALGKILISYGSDHRYRDYGSFWLSEGQGAGDRDSGAGGRFRETRVFL